MSEIITLYHGSITDFDEIDVSLGKPYKDFGQGFYCSETKSQAVGIATRNYGIELAKVEIQKSASIGLKKWLYTYEFPKSELANLSVKVFETADKEWL
jgi:hypothetical protein